MLKFLIVIGSLVVFVIFCFLTESNGGGTDNPFYIFCRLIARHIKLAAKLAVGFLVAFIGMMAILQINAEMREPVQGGNGGYQTEKLAGFINRATLPVQWAVDGFISLLGIVTMAILLGFEEVAAYYHQNPVPFRVAAFVLYLVWLGFNTYEIVSEELLSDNKVKRISWSLVTFFTWVSIVLSRESSRSGECCRHRKKGRSLNKLATQRQSDNAWRTPHEVQNSSPLAIPFPQYVQKPSLSGRSGSSGVCARLPVITIK